MPGSTLERIALHQTRLRAPGLSLDASGVALGARGLVLLPTIERLVSFLAVYTREHSLADPVAGAHERLELSIVRSALGAREIVLTLPATSTTLLDAVADVARLTGGLVFTGARRYWVQYRDRLAPFGYDVVELLRAGDEVDFALHHTSFTQAYARERDLDLATLLARVEPRRDASSTPLSARPLWLLVEPGLAPVLARHLARAGVDAELGLLELAPSSSLDDRPRRLALVRVAELPARLARLVTTTPGITPFAPAGPGVAVEVGHRHPIALAALPAFAAEGLALLPRPGPTRAPTLLARLPTLAPVASLVDVHLGEGVPATASGLPWDERLSLPVRLAPSVAPARAVAATMVSILQAPLLRRLAYALPASVVEGASIARARLSGGDEVLLLRAASGAPVVPLGALFSERAQGLFVLAGHDLLPAAPPAHVAKAIGASSDLDVFLYREAGDAPEALRAFALASSAFVPLCRALVTPEGWGALAPAEVVELARDELETAVGAISMDALGVLPMRNVE